MQNVEAGQGPPQVLGLGGLNNRSNERMMRCFSFSNAIKFICWSEQLETYAYVPAVHFRPKNFYLNISLSVHV